MTGAIQTVKIRLPTPHAGQIAVRNDLVRWNWISAGRRWRKTTLLMSLGVEAAVKGQRIGWGAPTYDQVRIGWAEARKAAGEYANFTQMRMTAEFPNGGLIIFRSLDDPDNARGHSADGWLFDEIGDIKSDAYYEVVYPMLIENQDSWFVGAGTPKGRNWFWREWTKAKEKEESMSWQIPTIGCEIVNGDLIRKPHPLENPDIPFDEVYRMWQSVPESTFKQEILAEFVEWEGAVFRNIAACMNAPETTPEQHAGHLLVMGVDWGKHQDFTTLSVGCVNCRCEVDKDRFNKIDYNFQRGRLVAMSNKWGVKRILAESNSMGEPNIDQLRAEGRPITGFATTATSKPPLIMNLALALEKEEWQFIDDPVWTGELEAYEQKVSATTGRSTYSAPQGMNDDTVMGRALMLRAADVPYGADLIAFV